MKTGKTVTELATELERQAASKRDFLAPTSAMEVGYFPDSKSLYFHLNEESFDIKETAHDQIASRLDIPKKYYDRMMVSAPELLTENINHWLHAESDKRLIRVMDGGVRAFLSDRFRPLDNIDLATAVLPILLQNGVEVRSSEITERRMYIQAVTPRIQGEVKKGDIVQAGIAISNSEIGAGSLRVEPLMFRLTCLNGMITSYSIKKYHIGKTNELLGGEDGQFERLLTDGTKSLRDQAFWRSVQDIVRGSFKEDIFNAELAKFQEAAGVEIQKDPLQLVEELPNHFNISEGEKGSILKNLIKGGDLTKWGLANAITAVAHESESYDRSIEFERMGSEVIELPKKDWDALAN